MKTNKKTLLYVFLTILFVGLLPAVYSIGLSPILLNETPASRATAVKLSSNISISVQDPEGGLMNISFSVYNSSNNNWRVVRTYSNVLSGNYSTSAPNSFITPLTNYQWKVTVSDNGGNIVEQAYNFTTGGLLTQKWNINVGNTPGSQIFPVMGDIDKDGTQEIVMSAGSRVVVVNGKTGAIKWTADGSTASALELVDLNNDGTPEILYGISGPRLRALNGDGSIRWTSQDLTGDGQSLYPIVAYDIDGDGYPTIYFASEDTDPVIFSGDLGDYQGALNMLDHNGNVLKTAWLYHPCWGGLAIGDVNFDGTFEIYVSDRRYGYNNVPANGIQAFNAHTLEPLWSRSEFQHSSPMPVIANITNDNNLEVIATMITHKGPAVLNGITGETIYDYTDRRLPTHGTPTVYDLDKDGHMEIIYATSYPDTSAPEFAVFDLISGTTEFRPVLDYQVTWPPKLGDVTGDGIMDILAATGSQGKGAAAPLLIYNNNYTLIDRVDITGALAGQLMPAMVYDTDSDGYNEVVLASANGRLIVFDTKARVASPAPRTWNQMYSEYREGVAEYVAPPGPNFPIINSESPKDDSVNISLNPLLSIRTYDYQKDLVNIKFEVYQGFQWKEIRTYNNQVSGVYTANANGYIEDYDTDFKWRVTSTDSKGNSNQKEFNFKTIKQPAVNQSKPTITSETPENNAKTVPQTTTQLRFRLLDGNNDLMNYTVRTTPDIGSANGTNVINGYYTVPISGLKPNSEYIWQVRVTDGKNITYKELKFTTPYILSLNNQGDGNILATPPSPYGVGSIVQVTANASPNWEFIGWSGDLSLGENPATITMDSSKNITARFRQKSADLIEDSDFEESIDSKELIYDGSWQDWFESRKDKQDILAISEENIGGNIGKKAKLNGFIARNGYLTQEFKQPVMGEFALQWDVYVDSILDNTNAMDNAGIAMIGDNYPYSMSGPNSGSSRNFAWLGFYKEFGGTSGMMNLTAIDRNGTTLLIAKDLNLKQWYTIKVISNISKGTYNVYINGVLKAENITSRSVKTNVTHITFAQGSDGVGTFYIDNVKEVPVTVICVDSDGDGFNSTGLECGPKDCNDANVSIYPGAVEKCNNVDDDCNALTIDGSGVIAPLSGLQAGVCSGSVQSCTAGIWVNNFSSLPNYEPVESKCDSLDNDCDVQVDENGVCIVSPSGWLYKKSITVDHTKVSGNLQNFQVLIDITDADLSGSAQTDGKDIWFSAQDGVTKLSHEIESYSAGHLIAWVKTDVSSTEDTVMYMYYGNSNASNQEAPEKVWDSNYLSVHHLEEKSGAVIDTTGRFNGTALNGVSQTETGKFDGAYGFDGTNDRVQMPRIFTSETQFTVEGWMNPSLKQGYAFSQRDTASRGTVLQYFTDGTFQFYVNAASNKTKASPGVWHYVVATYDGSTARLYVDAGTPSQFNAALTWPNVGTFFGDRTQGDRQYMGMLDEMRLSNIARSNDYIKTSYNNQNNPQLFFNVGSQENNAPITCTDNDGDKFNSTGGICGPKDCNDANVSIYPGAVEKCNNVDDDCNAASIDGSGQIAPLASLQAGVCSGSVQSCTAGIWVNDFSALPNYEPVESKCDSLDNDCDVQIDENNVCSVTPSVWAYRKQITIDHTKVSSDLADFPVLIALNDADLLKAQEDGGDILFVSDDGVTNLTHEIESYSNGNLVAWVKIPQLSSTQDTNIYMYYGNADVSNQEAPEKVWDSNYLSVHHLEEKSGAVIDTTGRFNGTALNGVSQTETGKFDGAYGFDGTNDRVQMPRIFTGETQFTVEGWMNPSLKQGYAFSQRDTASRGTVLQYFTDGTFQFYVNAASNKTKASPGVWHYVVATYDGSTARLYVDAGTPSQFNAALTWPNVGTFFGDRTQGDRQYMGMLDEMRLSNIARSNDYIKTSYNNQNNPAAFYTVESEESLI